MIFNKSVFEKLLKEAYKGAGLLVTKKEGRIALAGSWWVITMSENVFSNDGKAALVKLTGELPVQGECWRVTSGGNQVEIPPDYIDIDGDFYELITRNEPFNKTIITMDGLAGGLIRLYQRDKIVICINELVNMLLDPSAVKDGEDDYIRGPYVLKMENPSMYYWYTDECSFAAGKLDLEKDEYKELLAEIAYHLTLPVARA